MISPRLAIIPRTIVDVKIVIVGASDCGVAFAEYLAMRYIYLRYDMRRANNSLKFAKEFFQDFSFILLYLFYIID